MTEPRREAALRDGQYRMRFSLGAHRSVGTLTVAGSSIIASCPDALIDGTVTGDGDRVTARIGILEVSPSRCHAPGGHFTVQMTGVSGHDGFSVLGAGPRGAIVEIDCTSEPDAPTPS